MTKIKPRRLRAKWLITKTSFNEWEHICHIQTKAHDSACERERKEVGTPIQSYRPLQLGPQKHLLEINGRLNKRKRPKFYSKSTYIFAVIRSDCRILHWFIKKVSSNKPMNILFQVTTLSDFFYWNWTWCIGRICMGKLKCPCLNLFF